MAEGPTNFRATAASVVLSPVLVNTHNNQNKVKVYRFSNQRYLNLDFASEKPVKPDGGVALDFSHGTCGDTNLPPSGRHCISAVLELRDLDALLQQEEG